MEHLLATWIVKVWQNRRLDQHAPAWDPGGRHSPNTLFAAAAARDGICLEIPRPGLYYELLPACFVKIDRRRGVKIGGLWYGGGSPVLTPTAAAPPAGAAGTAESGPSAAIPGIAGRCSSKIPPTAAGMPCAGTGFLAVTTSRPSPMRGSASCCGKPPDPASSRARMANCCRYCWTWWPHGPLLKPGRPR